MSMTNIIKPNLKHERPRHIHVYATQQLAMRVRHPAGDVSQGRIQPWWSQLGHCI